MDKAFKVFLSAWRQELPLIDNIQRMAVLDQYLREHYFQPELAYGVFDSEPEQSIMVPVNSTLEAEQLANYVGETFSQVCVLVVSNQTNNAHFLYPGGKVEQAGKWTAACIEDIQDCTFWRGVWWSIE